MGEMGNRPQATGNHEGADPDYTQPEQQNIETDDIFRTQIVVMAFHVCLRQ